MNGPRNSFVLGFLFACCVTYGAYQTGRAFLHPKQGVDFAPGFVAAKLVHEGRAADLYDERVIAARADELGLRVPRGAEDPIPRYCYPPWVVLVYAPLSGLDWNTARSLWFLVELTASFSAAYLMGRTLDSDPNRRSIWVLVSLAATCVYFPTTYGLMGGQANDLQLLAIVACLALLKVDRPFLAGMVLAPAGMWKIFTAIPLIFLLVRREWRALAGFAAGAAALVLVSLPVTGIEAWTNWYHLMRESYSTAVAVPRNHSIAASMQSLFSASLFGRPIVDAPGTSRVATLVLQLLVAAAAGFILGPFARRHEPRYALQFSITLVAAVLLVPMSWEHYGVFLLPAFLACAALALQFAPERLPAAALGLSFGLWAFVLQLGSEYAALSGRLYALVTPVKMFATLVLLALSAWLTRRAVRRA